MSRVMAQPIGQKRLTNIAIVRYKKMGKRFEIACYKNKIMNWRNGIEKDLDEVVQTTTIFANVSKGVLAKHEDLQLVFGSTNQDKVCRIILADGEMQVSDKERKLQYDTLFKDIASVLVAKCVNSETNRPYTISMLERSLRDIHFAVDPKRGAKQQALDAVSELQKVIPIRRAMMRLKLQVALAAETELEQMLRKEHAVIETQSSNQTQVTVVCLVEPGCFREVHSFTQTAIGGGGRIDVVALAATEEGDGSTEFASSAAGFAERLQISANREQAASVARAAAASITGSGFVAVSTAGSVRSREPTTADMGSPVYEGPVEGMPEEHASRKERFAELDQLQPGWIVQLRSRGDAGTVDAHFVSPGGERVTSFAIARRSALAASKAAKSSTS